MEQEDEEVVLKRSELKTMIDDVIEEMMTLIDERTILALKLGSDEARPSPMGAAVSVTVAAAVDEYFSRRTVIKKITSEVEREIPSPDVVTETASELVRKDNLIRPIA